MWVFLSPIVVTYAYIFFSGRSRETHVPPSTPTAMLPYRFVSFDTSAKLRRQSLCPLIIHAAPLD